MKRIAAWMLAGALILSLAACGSADDPQNEQTAHLEDAAESGTDPAGTATVGDPEKILIAYFAVAENSEVDAISSASVAPGGSDDRGLVRVLAEDIQSVTGGDLFSIQTSVDYPGSINALIDYAAEEQDEDARPDLTSHIENLDDYGTIFVGYPNWWYDMPMVMYSFFEEYDFSGKTIIPFNSHNGSRFSNTIRTIQELEPDAAVIEDGFTVNQSGVMDAADDIADWLDGLGF